MRRRSASRPCPVITCATARTIRAAARLSAKAVLSPIDAGAIATAATPTGTLPARNSNRSRGTSAPSRL